MGAEKRVGTMVSKGFSVASGARGKSFIARKPGPFQNSLIVKIF